MQSCCSYLGIWRVAYPLVLMNAGLTIMHFCDRKFLAMHSARDVAAALPAGILSFTLTSFFLALVAYTSTVVAQYFGREEFKSCVKATWNGFYLSLGAGAMILLLMPWLGLFILGHSGHAPEIMELERTYFITLIPSGAFMCTTAALTSFFNGLGRTRYAAAINIFGCGVNVILDYMLIFGKWGAPSLGIRGAGIATSIACGVSFVLAASFFLGQNQQRYPTRSHRTFAWEEIRRLFRFGTPSALQILADVGAFTAFAFLVGIIDQEAMVVTTIALAINQLAFYPMIGLAESSAILTGQLMGAHHANLVYRMAYRTWQMATIYMGVMAAFYLLAPEWLFNQFAPNQSDESVNFDQVVRNGKYLLICVLIYNFFDAIKFVFMGVLRGAGDTKACVIITSCCAWGLMVPGMAILIFYFKIGIVGVWIYTSCCILLESSIYFFRFRFGKWKQIRVIENPLEKDKAVESIAGH